MLKENGRVKDAAAREKEMANLVSYSFVCIGCGFRNEVASKQFGEPCKCVKCGIEVKDI